MSTMDHNRNPRFADFEALLCLCWVGHGDCGGCSGYPGIKHEPACGYEQHPDCPIHPPERLAGCQCQDPKASRIIGKHIPTCPLHDCDCWRST